MEQEHKLIVAGTQVSVRQEFRYVPGSQEKLLVTELSLRIPLPERYFFNKISRNPALNKRKSEDQIRHQTNVVKVCEDLFRASLVRKPSDELTFVVNDMHPSGRLGLTRRQLVNSHPECHDLAYKGKHARVAISLRLHDTLCTPELLRRFAECVTKLKETI